MAKADSATDRVGRVIPMPPIVDEVVGADEKVALHVRLFGSDMFFRLWLAQVVSALGDWLGFLAITILAARVGGGSAGAAVGLVMIARILPGFFLAPVAGVMVDRWDRKRVMVVCNLIRAGVVALLPFVDTVMLLVLASFALEVCTLLWSPAKEATVPNLVPADRLTNANSLSLAAAYGTFPIAAVLFALLAGISKRLGRIDALNFFETDQEALAFYLFAVGLLVSAGLIRSLRLPESARRAKPKTESDGQPKRVQVTQAFHELKEGWTFIFINPVVRSVNLGLATGLFGGGMVVPLGSIFSTEVLGAGPAGYGVFVTALGFGVTGGVLLLSVTQKRLPKARIFELSLLTAGGGLIFAASMSTLTLAVIGVAVLGVCAGSVYVIGFTLLHEHVDHELRGRVFSALYSLVRLCLLLAFALGPFLSELLDRLSSGILDDRTVHFPAGGELFLPGVRLTLWLAGAIVIISGFVTIWSLRGTKHLKASLSRVIASTGDEGGG